MATKAYKTTIEFVVYHDAPLGVDEASYDGDMYDLLKALIDDATEGDKIGDWHVIKLDEPVEGEQLVKELVAIGNDGAFFDDPFGEEASDE